MFDILFYLFFIVFFIVFFIILATALKVIVPGIYNVWISGRNDQPQRTLQYQLNYECLNCGADLGKGVDVSPSGDVKCEYCSKWFNIHKQIQ